MALMQALGGEGGCEVERERGMKEERRDEECNGEKGGAEERGEQLEVERPHVLHERHGDGSAGQHCEADDGLGCMGVRTTKGEERRGSTGADLLK